MRLLIVEDEAVLRENLARQFEAIAYAVDSVADGEEGLYLGQEVAYDVAIIDLGLPKMSGMELIKRLRAQQRTFPILILTAQGGWQDKVAGLDAGADDYLTKPFHFEELLARVRALLRRSYGKLQDSIEVGALVIDTAAQKVWVAGALIELTAYEYRLLCYLAHNSGVIVSKTDLTEHIYDQDFDCDSNVIEVFVGRLRKKLDPEQKHQFIETVRGRGYRFLATELAD